MTATFNGHPVEILEYVTQPFEALGIARGADILYLDRPSWGPCRVPLAHITVHPQH